MWRAGHCLLPSVTVQLYKDLSLDRCQGKTQVLQYLILYYTGSKDNLVDNKAISHPALRNILHHNYLSAS